MFFHEYPYTDFHELNLDWLIKTVKELAKKVNSINIDEIRKEVEEYLASLDIDQKVRDEIQKLIDDGTLGSVIEHVAVETIRNERLYNTVYPSRISRYIGTSNGINNLANIADGDNTYYSQGLCITPDGILMALVDSDIGFSDGTSLETAHTNNTRFVLIDFDGIVKATTTVADGYHSNWLTFKDGFVYSSSYSKFNNTADLTTSLSDVKGVQVLQYSYNNGTLNLTKTNTVLNDDVWLSLTNYNDAWYGLTKPLGTFYTIYNVDLVTGTKTALMSFDSAALGITTVQGIRVYNNKIYVVCYKPSSLFVFNLESHELESIANFEAIYGNNQLGELESIDINTNGDIYLNSTIYGTVLSYANKFVNQVWKFNIRTGGAIYEAAQGHAYRTLYVDSNSADHNPTGRESSPYKSISECLISAAASSFVNTIFIKGSFNDEILVDTKGYVYRGLDGVYTVPGVYLTGCSNVSFSSDLNVKYNQNFTNVDINAPIYMYRCGNVGIAGNVELVSGVNPKFVVYAVQSQPSVTVHCDGFTGEAYIHFEGNQAYSGNIEAVNNSDLVNKPISGAYYEKGVVHASDLKDAITNVSSLVNNVSRITTYKSGQFVTMFISLTLTGTVPFAGGSTKLFDIATSYKPLATALGVSTYSSPVTHNWFKVIFNPSSVGVNVSIIPSIVDATLSNTTVSLYCTFITDDNGYLIS